MLILVNKNSNSGEGARKWATVEKKIKKMGLSYDANYPSSEQECIEVIKNDLTNGRKVFIAAGGDGTANLVLNTIIDKSKDRVYPGIAYGAIGLGSSNDFHKPFDEYPDIDGIPYRVDHENAKDIDVGKLLFTDINGKEHVRYFVLNSSIGFVAECNDYFNSGKKVLNWINSKSNDIAILYTTLVQLFKYKNIKLKLSIDDGQEEDIVVSNMSICKKVQFAGDFRYDTPVTEDDGMFDVCIWGDMNKLRLIKTIMALSEGKFTGLPGTQVYRAKKVKIISEKPISLETDGEISKILSAELSVLPKILKVCR
jgi:diacylglycerol kinase family enzyme